MDIGKSFSFVFQDPNWVGKIIIGGLLSLIPVVGWLLVIGYMIAIARNVINGDPQPLPEWSDFGQILVDGIYGFVIGFVYSLPIIVVACFFWTPASLITSDGGDAEALFSLLTCCFSLFVFLYAVLVGWFFIPAALGRFAKTQDLASALRFGEILDISRANVGAYLVALLVSWVVGFLASFGVILCCIGVIFTAFYSQCVTGHVYGQAYVLASEEVI